MSTEASCSPELHVIILAAGEGKRMCSKLPKALQPIGDRPMLAHVISAVAQLKPKQIHVVHGDHKELFIEKIDAKYQVNWVWQAERKGTAHAVQQALPSIDKESLVLILYADHPLISVEILITLFNGIKQDELRLLTTELTQSTGYGRVMRDGNNEVVAIVEEKDATDEQREINEINTGILLGQQKNLNSLINQIKNNNAQQEFYLTDIVYLANKNGVEITAIKTTDIDVIVGANDKKQLARLERTFQRKQVDVLLNKGMSFMDPDRCDIRGAISCGSDVEIDVDVIFSGDVELGEGVKIGPFCYLKNCTLAPGTIVHSHCNLNGVTTTGACEIGPYARLRPETVLQANAKIGNFVEVKKSAIGENSKVNHLSYIGDATVAEDVNIGAGTITCNYDGANKHQTIVEQGAFIGSGTQLVAPVTVAKKSTIGAGSTITKNTKEQGLTLARSKQIDIKNWKRPRKN